MLNVYAWPASGGGVTIKAPDAAGDTAGRDAYDAEAAGFVYADTSVAPAVLYVRIGATPGTWSGAIPWQGPAGANGSQIIGTAGAPAAGVGEDGWLAWDAATRTLYQKSGGSWGGGTLLDGTAGAPEDDDKRWIRPFAEARKDEYELTDLGVTWDGTANRGNAPVSSLLDGGDNAQFVNGGDGFDSLAAINAWHDLIGSDTTPADHDRPVALTDTIFTLALRTAIVRINKVYEGRPWIKLPAGEFNLSATQWLKGCRTRIKGAGMRGTTIKIDKINTPLFQSWPTTDGKALLIEMEDLELVGGLYLDQSQQSDTQDNMISVRDVDALYMTRVRLVGSRRFGVHASSCKQARIKDCYFDRMMYDALGISNSFDVDIDGCWFTHGCDDSISLHSRSPDDKGGATVQRIRNCVLMGGHGIMSLGAQFVVMEGNKIFLNKGRAIRVGAGSGAYAGDGTKSLMDVIIRDNEVHDCISNQRVMVNAGTKPIGVGFWCIFPTNRVTGASRWDGKKLRPPETTWAGGPVDGMIANNRLIVQRNRFVRSFPTGRLSAITGAPANAILNGDNNAAANFDDYLIQPGDAWFPKGLLIKADETEQTRPVDGQGNPIQDGLEYLDELIADTQPPADEADAVSRVTFADDPLHYGQWNDMWLTDADLRFEGMRLEGGCRQLFIEDNHFETGESSITIDLTPRALALDAGRVALAESLSLTAPAAVHYDEVMEGVIRRNVFRRTDGIQLISIFSTIDGRGTLAARPAATGLAIGYRYVAIDQSPPQIYTVVESWDGAAIVKAWDTGDDYWPTRAELRLEDNDYIGAPHLMHPELHDNQYFTGNNPVAILVDDVIGTELAGRHRFAWVAAPIRVVDDGRIDLVPDGTTSLIMASEYHGTNRRGVKHIGVQTHPAGGNVTAPSGPVPRWFWVEERVSEVDTELEFYGFGGFGGFGGLAGRELWRRTATVPPTDASARNGFYWEAGEVVYSTDLVASAGVMGWVCTVAGFDNGTAVFVALGG